MSSVSGRLYLRLWPLALFSSSFLLPADEELSRLCSKYVRWSVVVSAGVAHAFDVRWWASGIIIVLRGTCRCQFFRILRLPLFFSECGVRHRDGQKYCAGVRWDCAVSEVQGVPPVLVITRALVSRRCFSPSSPFMVRKRAQTDRVVPRRVVVVAVQVESEYGQREARKQKRYCRCQRDESSTSSRFLSGRSALRSSHPTRFGLLGLGLFSAACPSERGA